MKHVSPLALQYRNALLALVDAIEAERGFSDTALSKAIFGYGDGIRTIRRWDGSQRAMNLNTAVRIEEFIRTNLRDDPAESEERYREVVRAALSDVIAEYGPQITPVEEAA